MIKIGRKNQFLKGCAETKMGKQNLTLKPSSAYDIPSNQSYLLWLFILSAYLFLF